mgnify:FL=1
MTALILVRHGESEWNREGRVQGQFDSPLTEMGVVQAKSVSRYLSGVLLKEPLRIYTSPLERASETASIIAEELQYPKEKIIIEQRLNDFNLGVIAGTYGWQKVAEMYPDLARMRLQDPLRFHPPGGECGADFEARLRSFLDDMQDDGITKLLVSHGIVNKFIRGIRRNLKGEEIIALGESQDTIYCLDHEQEKEINLAREKTE